MVLIMASKRKILFNAVVQVVVEEMATGVENEQLDPVMETLLRKRKDCPEVLGTARIPDYVENTVPTYSDPLFRAHFRMSRTSVQSLLELIRPHSTERTISLERRTLACLWYLSNQETFRSVADRFGLSKGSLHYYLGNFCRTMTSDIVLPTLICWPDRKDYPKIAEGFSQKAGFPGVIGVIDGTYIPIAGPSEFCDSYICRKGFPAFHLQGVCDSHMRFLDVFTAYPGSVHDSRVFRNSPLSEKLKNEVADNFHLIGDSAYSLSNYVLMPFRDNGHLTNEEKRYNYVHSSTRTVIEHCFGLLKGKFRKLKFLDIAKTSIVPTIIVTCCVLHNFILSKELFLAEEIAEVEEDEMLIDTAPSQEISALGSAKRNEIMLLLS